MRTSDTDGSGRRGKPRRNFGKQYESDWLGFVDIVLSDDEKDRIKGDVDGGLVPAPTFIQALLDQGYKLSLSPDGRGGGVIATVTGAADGCLNQNYSLSGRGPDVVGALAMLEYKVENVCHWGHWLDAPEAHTNQLKLWG